MIFLMATMALDISLSISWWVTKQIASTAINAVSYIISSP